MTDLLREMREQVQQARSRSAELGKQKTPLPSFVKASKKQTEEQKPRKRRESRYNRARKRSMSAHIVAHRIMACPDCHLRPGGISLARCREVIDVPPPPVGEVIEHRIPRGWCAGCHTWYEAPVDFGEQVLGQGRSGVRLACITAYLRTVIRLPMRRLRDVLRTLHGFGVSPGGLVHQIKAYPQPMLVTAGSRASPAIQADETGWREDGINSSIWSVSPPLVRYEEDHHSRAGEVVKHLIGQDYHDVLGSDFHAVYNIYQGVHQRCWVYLLRDIHDLKDDFPQDEQLRSWARDVTAIYEQAVAWSQQELDLNLSPRQRDCVRVAQQRESLEDLSALCSYDCPIPPLCKPVEQFLPECLPVRPGLNSGLSGKSLAGRVVAKGIRYFDERDKQVLC